MTLGFHQHLRDYHVDPEGRYYFKAVDTFLLPGLTHDQRFEEIDSYLVEAFRADFEDVLTVHTEALGPVIVMAESTLRRAGIELPPWPNPAQQAEQDISKPPPKRAGS